MTRKTLFRSFAMVCALLVACLWIRLRAQGVSTGLSAYTATAASYLYSQPTGSYTDISADSGLTSVALNTHDGGFDHPVQFTDGTHGTTEFNDYGFYSQNDDYFVPNITATGGFFPATGGYGADDGHLIVVDTSNRMAYDFFRLCTDSNGTPITCSGNPSAISIGGIKAFSLNASNGTPGTTASGLSTLVGAIMPGELNGSAMPHALALQIDPDLMNSTVCHETPANYSDGSGSGPFCEGAKVRMDPSVNVDSLTASAAAKSIMKAFQQYGGNSR